MIDLISQSIPEVVKLIAFTKTCNVNILCKQQREKGDLVDVKHWMHSWRSTPSLTYE